MPSSIALIIFFHLVYSEAIPDSEHIEIPQPTDFDVTEIHLGVFNFTWNSNLSYNKDYAVHYKVCIGDLGNEDCKEEERKVAHFRRFISRGVFAKVKTIVSFGNRKAESNWTVRNFPRSKGITEQALQNVSCILYNFDHINCTWETAKEVPDDAHYSVYFWQKNTDFPCHQFIRNDQRKITGCHSKKGTAFLDKSVHILINVSGADFYSAPRFRFNPYKIEKLNPPENITIEKKTHGLNIVWDQPYSLITNNKLCFIYEVNLNENERFFETLKINYSECSITTFDTTKSYSLQIRAKRASACRKNLFWSDWSKIITINDKSPDPTVPLVVIAVVLSALFLILLKWKGPKVLLKLFPPIPSPTNKIKQWLEKEDIIQPYTSKEHPTYIENIIKIEENDTL
ncbi:interleukin-5 receptor subunit alpha-like [Acipenser oxyrinchus oxyrinchus]|uniref:Interleukin-5 receptor subunit alpha-like n=1 Tax=Acipenser oxyrinchus oxyrinchus TaxID=40147 RepID=A0AAD8DE80_ACIOX|nr:interleukin-5 receptor subunit alpha-like [Acipenser oxyrinchus oxyrinchus]